MIGYKTQDVDIVTNQLSDLDLTSTDQLKAIIAEEMPKIEAELSVSTEDSKLIFDQNGRKAWTKKEANGETRTLFDAPLDLKYEAISKIMYDKDVLNELLKSEKMIKEFEIAEEFD